MTVWRFSAAQRQGRRQSGAARAAGPGRGIAGTRIAVEINGSRLARIDASRVVCQAVSVPVYCHRPSFVRQPPQPAGERAPGELRHRAKNKRNRLTI
jgi:hypothetical protein